MSRILDRPLKEITSYYHNDFPLLTRSPILFEKYCPFLPSSFQEDFASYTIGNIRVTVGERTKGKPLGVLRLRTHKIIFHTLIKIWEVLDYPERVYLNLVDLLEFFKMSTGGKSYINLKSYIEDLERIPLKFENVETGQTISNLKILADAVFYEKKEKDKYQLELFHAYYEFNYELKKIFKEYSKTVPIRLDQLLKLKTDVGISLYSMLAVVTHNNRLERTFTNLLGDLHLSSQYEGKVGRKRKLEKGIKEVDNKLLANGKRLRCRVEFTKDKKDYKIVAYQESLKEAIGAEIKDPSFEKLKATLPISLTPLNKNPETHKKGMPEQVGEILGKLLKN